MPAKHSPGAWRWVERKGHDMDALVDADEGTVCNFGNSTPYYPVEGRPPDQDDARLIAAAPELLEMVRLLLNASTSEWRERSARARALIRRVEEGT